MYKKIYKFSCLGMFLFLLSACAAAPQQNLAQEEKKGIRTIALLGIPDPKEHLIVNLGGAGMALGAVGGLIEGNRVATNSEKFTLAMSEQDIQIGNDLEILLVKQLKEAGYSVVVLDDVRPKLEEGKTPDYSDIKTDADVILDVWHSVTGFLSPSGKENYKTWVIVGARMVTADEKKPIFFQLYNYGEVLKKQESIIYYSEKVEHAYPDFESLMKNVPETKKALMASTPVISKGIADQLKH